MDNEVESLKQDLYLKMEYHGQKTMCLRLRNRPGSLLDIS